MLSQEKKEERERIKNGVHLTNIPYFVNQNKRERYGGGSCGFHIYHGRGSSP